MTDIFHSTTDNGELSQARKQATPEGERHVHIAIVGTGFSGLGAAIRLKQQGYEDFVVLERAGDIGGTWRVKNPCRPWSIPSWGPARASPGVT